MPYIAPEKRTSLDLAIKEVTNALAKLEMDEETNNFEGNLNYVISSIINKSYAVSYRDINDVIGVLECVKLEYYRRVAAPYEDQKAFDNGDVYD